MINNKGYSIIESGTYVIISQFGETSHDCGKMIDAIARHFNMTEGKGNVANWLNVKFENVDVYAFNRKTRLGMHFCMSMKNGEIHGCIGNEINYSELADRRAK